MAQHDFVSAWLNFSTPQSAKAPGATFEKHGEHLVWSGTQHSQGKPAGTPSGVWENPPSAKQPTKMLVIKKVSKEDPAAAFSAAFTSPGPQLSNGNKATPIVPSAYKNLVPKPAASPSKPNQWKANRNEHKPSSLTSSCDSAFTSPVSVTKPAVLTNGSVLTSSKESPSSTTPPVEINSSHLTKLMRRTTDKKSEFLKALKDDKNGELPERHENKLEDVDGGSTAEPKENWEENCHQNGLSLPLEENLSHSLEAEHRLLKAMGWQEYPENDENCLPLTEDELKELQIKSEQLRRNGFWKSEFFRGQGSSQLFSHWRSTFKTEFEESDTETSSSETSDDDA
uniref:GC-rich promoter binding protein 1 like 1 n=1 Tax=Pseudonaja textilis TaxID=8673 RepID=A0A670ZPQ6_PSETE